MDASGPNLLDAEVASCRNLVCRVASRRVASRRVASPAEVGHTVTMDGFREACLRGNANQFYALPSNISYTCCVRAIVLRVVLLVLHDLDSRPPVVQLRPREDVNKTDITWCVVLTELLALCCEVLLRVMV